MTFQDRVKERYKFLFLIAGSFLISLMVADDANSQQIHLNEVMPSNSSTIADEDGDYSDWIFFDESISGFSYATNPSKNFLEPPVFSHQAGFYVDAFELIISHSDTDVTIYYTLDGSIPTDQSAIYTDPIMIENRSSESNDLSTIPTNFISGYRGFIEPSGTVKKGTVIKTLAVKNGYEPDISKRSYFVFPDGSDTHQLPVISISTDRNNLFGFNDGIYVPGAKYKNGEEDTGNYYMRGIEWEREAGFEFFDENGEYKFGQNVGLRIHGGYSRRFTQKSLRVYARNQYGESKINFPIFKNKNNDSYNRIILRNSGNDLAFSMFRDAAAHQIVKHLNMDTQAHQPSIIYINGEYWGLHNIRERYDKHYLERVYGIDPDRIDILTGQWGIIEGDNQHYAALLTYIENENLGNQQNYEYVKTRIDIDNFLDYYIAEIFFVNTDWPHNNIDFWRSHNSYNPEAPPGQDGRWRWLFYDIDFTFGIVESADFDMMTWVTANRNYRNRKWPNLILRNLLDNEEFEVDFINRTADHLNTTFRPNRIYSIIDSLKTIIEPEMPDYIERWRYPTSLEVWENTISGMKKWASERPAFHRENVMKHFGIDSLAELIIEEYDQTKGNLYLNSLLIHGDTPGIDREPFPWAGTYFSGIPVKISAEAKGEYTFSHWQIDDQLFTTPTLTLLPDTTDTIRLFFEEVTVSEPEIISLAEENYLFNNFSSDTPRGQYPKGMRFVYMSGLDPGLESEIEGSITGSYNLSSRTRINGLGEAGFSFINTSNLDGNPGYPGRKLGGTVLYLNTEDRSNIEVEWNAGTMEPNSLIYNIRLQYRVGSEGLFKDILDESGDPVEYKRNEERGHEEVIGPIVLSSEVDDQSHVELLWRYYFTGERVSEESGQRSQLHISEISVTSKPLGYVETPDPDPEPLVPNSFKLYQNFPNPFHPYTTIQYDLPKNQHVKLEIFSISGQYIKTAINQQVPPGRHTVVIDASTLASGVYLYRITTNEFTETLRMSVIK